MFQYVFSIVLIVFSNVLYNICQKSVPSKVNPMVALLVTYLTAALITLVVLPFYHTNDGVISSFRHINWASFVLGFAIVGLELGYLLAYRAGWNISVGSLVANICLAVVLIPIGVFFYRENFSPDKLIGIVLCLAGLIFINKK